MKRYMVSQSSPNKMKTQPFVKLYVNIMLPKLGEHPKYPTFLWNSMSIKCCLVPKRFKTLFVEAGHLLKEEIVFVIFLYFSSIFFCILELLFFGISVLF